MDLPAVKALVKKWEKGFKAEHGRAPTKDDIKRDPNGIAEQYALYRRLSKTAGTSSSSQTSRPGSSSQSARTPQTIRRQISASDYPTTPTPPARRSSSRMSDVTAEEDQEDFSLLQAGPSGATAPNGNRLKRTASKAALNPPSSPAASRLLTTPKKRPYTGPIHDPNPSNPFASPVRTAGNKSDQPQPAISSPFVHASSPSKLKQLLEQNSLRKMQQRTSPTKEVTPRTKARKRLTGEMDETPVKARVRRKRGEGRGRSETADKVDEEAESGARLWPHGKHAGEEGDEDEDEMGPTPAKVASFHSFFDGEVPPSAGPSGSMMSKLQAASAKDKGKQRASQVTTEVPLVARSPSADAKRSSSEPLVASPTPSEHDESATSPLPLAQEDEEHEEPIASTSRRPEARPDKILSISDDEVDEWDPEAGHTRHRVKIVPTRSRPTRRAWSDDDDYDYDDAHGAPNGHDDSDEGGHDETVPALDDTTTSQTNPSVPSPPPPLLSLLSLTSPNQRQSRYAKLKELRYKALFNPNGTDAKRLRAFQKGQEAFLSGETEADDEEADLHALEAGGEDMAEVADDDWESESDGWKRTGVEMDDDAW